MYKRQALHPVGRKLSEGLYDVPFAQTEMGFTSGRQGKQWGKEGIVFRSLDPQDPNRIIVDVPDRLRRSSGRRELVGDGQSSAESARRMGIAKQFFKLLKVARLSEPRNRQVSAGTAELLCCLT